MINLILNPLTDPQAKALADLFQSEGYRVLMAGLSALEDQQHIEGAHQIINALVDDHQTAAGLESFRRASIYRKMISILKELELGTKLNSSTVYQTIGRTE